MGDARDVVSHGSDGGEAGTVYGAVGEVEPQSHHGGFDVGGG